VNDIILSVLIMFMGGLCLYVFIPKREKNICEACPCARDGRCLVGQSPKSGDSWNDCYKNTFEEAEIIEEEK